MKTKLIFMTAMATLALAVEAKRPTNSASAREVAEFDKWLKQVHHKAPRYGLKIQAGPDEREFFWLHCWQSDDHSVAHAIRYAKKIWSK